MSKVFLDVGAHLGETLRVAMEPRWGFDRIYSFEPAPQCWAQLESLADSRVSIEHFGLWTTDDTLVLHDPGEIGASLLEGKQLTSDTAEVSVRDAAAWFAEHLTAGDQVVVKINCEGAECDVLEHLLNAGELSKVDEMLVHFDVRKIPSKAYREVETRARLESAGIPYRPAEAIFFGRNIAEKTINWLSWYHARGIEKYKYSLLRRAEFAARVSFYKFRQGFK